MFPAAKKIKYILYVPIHHTFMVDIPASHFHRIQWKNEEQRTFHIFIWRKYDFLILLNPIKKMCF